MTDDRVEPIAVIGVACRVPGADDTVAFWRNLVAGTDSIRFFTREEQAALGVPEEELDNPDFVPAAPVLDDAEGFDARLFGMSGAQVDLTDPNHRLMLELARTALEDAGYDPARFDGPIGVYTGSGHEDYKFNHVYRNAAAKDRLGPLGETGLDTDYVATLTSFQLGLRGPSMTVHTACSTSLVTVHLACEALRAGECEIALAGGVHMPIPPGRGYVYVEGGILSPDGYCRPFDASAGGTIWGAGGGLVVLRPLSQALRDGDYVRAMIVGSAVNNDGVKDSFSGPSVDGQVEVITRALAAGRVDPRTVSYVEAHATGTAVGDPIEVAALGRVFGAASGDRGWCRLGSVKSNIGHLSQAAGIAGLVKTVLVLEHQQIPPTLHVAQPNPAIDLATGPFQLATELSDWEADAGTRRAGVSAFGVGGTNAHAVLQDAPPVERPRPDRRPAQLLRVSARTPTALTAAVERLATHLADCPGLDLADVAHTLAVGRAELPHRAVVVARDAADAAAALSDPKRLHTGTAPAAGKPSPRVAFLFSGQGAQYAGMGAQLYRSEPVFRDTVDECATVLAAELGEDIRSLLFPAPEAAEEADARLRQTALTQPALFTVEYALLRLWRSWGVQPTAMVGHSIGEYVAATAAGVFALQDALRLVATRGRLMQSMPAGSMLAVRLDATEVAARLSEGLAVATINGPGACVVAGPTAEVEAFAAKLEADDVGATPLRTSHAFHSAMMDPILDEFAAAVAAAPRRPPELPFLSNVTGDEISAEEATDPAYWARHLRRTVRFGDCVARLAAEGVTVLVECGPGHQLAGLARSLAPRDGLPPLPSLPGPGDRPGAPRGDLEVLGTAVGRLWTVGVPLDAAAFASRGYRVPLPTYPYERKRHWVDPDRAAAPAGPARQGQLPARQGQLPVDDWFAVPAWRQEVANAAPRPFSRCLAFTAGGLGARVADSLRAAGVDVVEAVPGEGYGLDERGRYTLRPGDRTEVEKLVADLVVGGGVPDRVLHAWTLVGEPAGADVDAAWRAQDLGFFSLLALVQALAGAQLADPVHLDVLTAGTEDVTGTDLTRPEHAAVAGVTRVVPLEIPSLTIRQIDLDPADAGSAEEGRPTVDPPAVEACVSELLREPDGSAVALRQGRRWRRDYQPVPVPAPADPAASLRDRGVYVITGGLGGIGLTLAEDLAHRARARLVLVGRGGLPHRDEWDDHLRCHGTADRAGRAIAAVRRIEAAGGEVLVIAADVSNVDDLRRVRAEALARFGRVDGIVHGAGVPGGGMAEVRERAAAEAVLAPKLAGVAALAQVFGQDELDFVALFSSVTAVAGSLGQVDYCAANAILDAAARGRHGFRARVVSIDWGAWLDVGMAAEASEGRGVAVDHPMLTSRRDTDDGRVVLRGLLSPATSWILAEHRVDGIPALPGTAYLELAVTALREAVPPPPGEPAIELEDVTFTTPLIVPPEGSVELEVTVTPGPDGSGSTTFQVASWSGGTTLVHARGSARWVDAGPAPRHDLAAVRARCVPAADRPGGGEAGLVALGPHWPVPAKVHVGGSEQLALVELADVPTTAPGAYWLHPVLLDGATAFPRPPDDDGGDWLPLGYGRLVARGPLPTRVWNHIRYRDVGSGGVRTTDVTLVDDDGREVVAVTDLLLRRVDGAAGPAAAAAPAARAVPAAELSAEPPASEVVADGEREGIRPSDGADAFARVLAADLGPQVVISAVPLDELRARISALTTQTMGEAVDEALDDPDDDGAAEQVRVVDGDYVGPRTELEATLARVYGEVLGVGQVGVFDDFFDMGGNSLLGVQLIAAIRKAVGAKLPMRALFDQPTIAEIAAQVEELRGTDTAEEKIPRLSRR
jgi:acyl transferase domain-containing protein